MGQPVTITPATAPVKNAPTTPDPSDISSSIGSAVLTAVSASLTRGLRDFTDNEVAIAGAVQSVLSLLTRRPVARLQRDEASADQVGLTSREQQVLCLVVEGYTAHRIGSVLRIAPSTVRKHLEHVYAKLGAHDRLLAVQRARDLGLV